MARALVWDPQFATLPTVLTDQKLCEYTRLLLLSALEQRVYAKIEAKPAGPKPVRLWKKSLAWLAVVGIAILPMCVPQPPHRRVVADRRRRLSSPALLCVYAAVSLPRHRRPPPPAVVDSARFGFSALFLNS